MEYRWTTRSDIKHSTHARQSVMDENDATYCTKSLFNLYCAYVDCCACYDTHGVPKPRLVLLLRQKPQLWIHEQLHDTERTHHQPRLDRCERMKAAV